MTNRVVHFEIPADDLAPLKSFYEHVFGWRIEKWEEPEAEQDYWMIMTGAEDAEGGIDGGMMTRQNPEQQVINTIDVNDIDAAIKKIQDHGGTIIMEKMEVPNIGLMAYFEDPQNNVFGIMESYEMEEAPQE